MLVSVITPTYNSQRTLRRCIESVAKQRYSNFEHLIVDGCSTDGTKVILEEAAARYPHVRIVSEPDRGAYDAMNKGLLRSRGDYVMFLGSDDELAEESVLESVFGRLSPPYPDVIYGNVRAVGGGIQGGKEGDIYDGEFTLAKLLRKNICHQAIFYSRGMVEKAGLYNTNYRCFADWDYNLRCFALGEFRYVDLVVSNFSTGGMSGRDQDLVFCFAFFDEIKRYFGISLFDGRLRELAWWIGMVGKVRLRQQHDKQGFTYIIAACYHSPRYAGYLALMPFRLAVRLLQRPFGGHRQQTA